MKRKGPNMARKPALARLATQAKKLKDEKRWLALEAHWLQATRRVSDVDLLGVFTLRAEEARAHFEAACANSTTIHMPTPNRCPFNCYDVFSSRKRIRGVQPAAQRAVERALLYKKEAVVFGFTLNGERHRVLVVNKYGEVTFAHPQFKVKLSESGGVV